LSKGAGTIEQRIADLFAATRNRALSIGDVADNAYRLNGATPTRAQRLSATRAAHRLLKRVRQTHDRARSLVQKAHANTKAALGREEGRGEFDREYDKQFHQDPAWIEARKLFDFCRRIGHWSRHLRVEGKPGWRRVEDDFWLATTVKGRLYFHPPDVPVQVWAVSITRQGVIWADAEVVRVTARNVMVRYAGEIARLDRRRLWHWSANWRGVTFVSSRTGRIAAALDEQWERRYGAHGTPSPSMQMPLADAIRMLGVPVNYTREDVIAAFRKAAKRAHPDAGGSPEMFRKFVEARDRLLAALGTSAPPPKPPSYAPKGVRVIYRVGNTGPRRLAAGMRRLT
jgi:hypothetical protein